MRQTSSWIFPFAPLLFLAGFACFACGGVATDSGRSGNPPVDGGAETSGNGGTGGGGIGSDAGPLAPPAQVILAFTVDQSALAVGRCPGFGLGGIIGGPLSPPASVSGPPAVDGMDGARIACRVSGNGSFDVTGSAEKLPSSFVLTDGKVTAGGTGTGAISVVTLGGQALTSPNDTPCELQVSTGPTYVDPGRISAGFRCPLVVSPTQSDVGCMLNGGFMFENCER
jgi:hypothetical protein